MADPKPALCRIVLYRSVAGIDMPAIVTQLIDPHGSPVDQHADDDPDQAVHLTPFPPPGGSVKASEPGYEWGVAHGTGAGQWRWPERKP